MVQIELLVMGAAIKLTARVEIAEAAGSGAPITSSRGSMPTTAGTAVEEDDQAPITVKVPTGPVTRRFPFGLASQKGNPDGDR